MESFIADIREYETQLETVVETLLSDPGNTELQNLKAELEEAISVTQSAIQDLAPVPAQQRKQKTPPPATEEKWSREKHPAFQPGYRRPGAPPSPVDEPQAPVALQVNDTVLAKWVSGDKAFYPARIASITGSSADPVYYVTFKSYGNSETLRKHDIKPITNESKKRKADDSSNSTAPPPPGNVNVLSAAADINPDIEGEARKELGSAGEGAARPAKTARKVKATKQLEAGKSKWQEFANKKNVSNVTKKDSMFRTGQEVNARGQLILTLQCLVYLSFANGVL